MTSLMSHTLSLDVIEMFAQDASHVSEVLVPHVGPVQAQDIQFAHKPLFA